MQGTVIKEAKVDLVLSWRELEKLHRQIQKVITNFDATTKKEELHELRAFCTLLYQAQK